MMPDPIRGKPDEKHDNGRNSGRNDNDNLGFWSIISGIPMILGFVAELIEYTNQCFFLWVFDLMYFFFTGISLSIAGFFKDNSYRLAFIGFCVNVAGLVLMLTGYHSYCLTGW